MPEISVLVDANVLLRLFEPEDELSATTSAAVDILSERKVDLCIVTQNLIEFWAVATRPSSKNGLGMNAREAATRLLDLRRLFRFLDGGSGIVDEWESLVLQHSVLGKQTHDAHLVAAMNVYGVRRILTFNGDHFQRFPSIEAVSPASVLPS